MNKFTLSTTVFSALFCVFLYAPVHGKAAFCDPKLGWAPSSGYSGNILLEGFEKSGGWTTYRSKNELIELSSVAGKFDNALRFKYDFAENGQWVIISKPVAIDLDKSFLISFWLRARGPGNLIEFHIKDADGGTFNRSFLSGTKTSEWHKEQFHSSELVYGWGGTNRVPDPPYNLEIAISKGYGKENRGAGWIEVDELRIEGTDPRVELSLNQIGFDPSSSKNAVLKLLNFYGNVKTPAHYRLISLPDGKEQYSGDAPASVKGAWGKTHWVLGFDSFKTPGKYKLLASVVIGEKKMDVESYPFKIENGILLKELSASQFHYIQSTRCPKTKKRYDPVPGGYIDTEFDMEKWMTTTPTWMWAMARWYNLTKGSRLYGSFDPIDEITYAAKFCVSMIDKETGGVYTGVLQEGDFVKGRAGWPADLQPEDDTTDFTLAKGHGADINTAYAAAMAEVYICLKDVNPKLAKESLDAAELAWRYLSEMNINQSSNIGMFLWASMRLYEATDKKAYLERARQTAEQLLPFQFLDYKRSDDRIFGRFFNTADRNNFNHQHKFVHAMGIQMGLLELAEQLPENDPLRKDIMFHLDCFAYGYLKRTSEMNPYGLVAQALEPGADGKMKVYFFSSPKTIIQKDHGLNCDIMAMGLISLRYSRLTHNPVFARIAADQIGWVLGKNPLGFCMVSGKGTTNPYIYASDFGKGPVLGGLPNGFVSPGEDNNPMWVNTWNSGEYWKPHNAMLLALMAELETNIPENPQPAHIVDTKDLLDEIDSMGLK
ncbi:MAG: glycoside hydrolase family 9 protein [Elusimicrobiota bacterium]